jgi:hypothetical protein
MGLSVRCPYTRPKLRSTGPGCSGVIGHVIPRTEQAGVGLQVAPVLFFEPAFAVECDTRLPAMLIRLSKDSSQAG